MEPKTRLKDCRKLWDRLKLIHNNVELVGDQLSGQFDHFNMTYRNIKRYFSKYFCRNPSEMKDLINIISLKTNSSSSIYKVYLEDNDFKNIELQLSIYQSLRNLHNILTGDVIRILAKEHSEYLKLSKHYRSFNKVLQCIYDSKATLETLENLDPVDKFSSSENDLPPHEKLWYLYCLIEREILASCSFLESVDMWEKQKQKRDKSPELSQGFLPQINNINKIPSLLSGFTFPSKKETNRQIKKSNSSNNWQDNLRNHDKLSSQVFKQSSTSKELDQIYSEEIINSTNTSNLKQDLKICKWNFKEPSESSRTFRPLCNRTFLIRNKNAVSKPHGLIKPYLAKISISSHISQYNDDKDELELEIDPNSGRMISIKDPIPTKTKTLMYIELQKINKKLSLLQETINEMISDRDNIEQIINNPLRNQVQKSFEWLKGLYLSKSHGIENTQNQINQLRIEKSLFLQNHRKN